MDSTTADANNSRALVRKRTDTELMPPPPPAKKVKRPRKVLDEDTYTESLSKIIARDFFPGLLETETQQEYLDAVESKDEAWITSATRRLQRVMTPGPQEGGKTPASASAEQSPSKLEVDTSMSLGAFQATYTSEDNESFYKVIDKQNEKKADKYAWLWRGNRLPSKRELKQQEVEASRGGERLIPQVQGEDDRPAMADTWKSKANNELMFIPDGVEERRTLAAEKARFTPQLSHANTRMPQDAIIETTGSEKSVPPSPSLSAIRGAIRANPPSEYADSSTGGGSETPRVNGYAFVDDEEPDGEEEKRAKVTVNLGPGDAIPNPFSIKQGSEREALHRRMVERIAESKRTSKKMGMTGKEALTPALNYPASPRVTGNLTPAAQRLWSNLRPGGATPSRTPSSLRTPAPTRPGITSKR